MDDGEWQWSTPECKEQVKQGTILLLPIFLFLKPVSCNFITSTKKIKDCQIFCRKPNNR